MSVPGHGEAGASAPVCPRHPDRAAYVRCQRCARPVCPQCQRPAPVGVQCVDCVARAEAAMPVRRTVFGGRQREGRPVLTLAIIALCVVAYAVQRVVPGMLPPLVFMPALGEVEPHRFLTSAFLHGGFFHLAVNMYALWIVGSVLEPALGRWRYVSLYVISALGGSAAVVLFASPYEAAWVTPVVGASGAVFGLFAAIGIALRRLGRDITQILVLLVINAAIGFIVPNIAWEAHLGGLVTGALLAAAYVYAPRKRATVVSVAATVGVLLLVAAVVVVKYLSSPWSGMTWV